MQRLERTPEGLGPLGRQAHKHHAGEHAGHLRDLAAFPATTVVGDDLGERLDEPGPVGTDHGQHEGLHARTVAHDAGPRRPGLGRGRPVPLLV